jgi:hypothetical protein
MAPEVVSVYSGSGVSSRDVWCSDTRLVELFWFWVIATCIGEKTVAFWSMAYIMCGKRRLESFGIVWQTA